LPPGRELIGLRQVDGMAQREPCQESETTPPPNVGLVLGLGAIRPHLLAFIEPKDGTLGSRPYAL